MNSSDELRKLRKALGIAQMDDALEVTERDVIVFESQPTQQPVQNPARLWRPKDVKTQ